MTPDPAFEPALDPASDAGLGQSAAQTVLDSVKSRHAQEAVVYRGPWKSVVDDDGHTLHRGQRTAVSRKTFQVYASEPYAESVLPVPPLTAIEAENAPLIDCAADSLRTPAETKRGATRPDVAPGTTCHAPADGTGTECC